MINLAGNKDCDTYIKQELQAAGIPIKRFYGEHSREVPFTLEGELFDWKFNRAWYYWVVSGGRMPLPLAQALYNKDADKVIRVAGHCGAPAPELPWIECYDANGYSLYNAAANPEPPENSTLRRFYDDIKLEGSYVEDQMAEMKFAYVSSYHIDTQDGLNMFAKLVKAYEKLAYAAALAGVGEL